MVFRKKYRLKFNIRSSLTGLEYNEVFFNIPLYYSFLLADLTNQKEQLSISDFAFKNTGTTST